MLCIGYESFIYGWREPIFVVPPKGAAAMPTFRSILDGIRELGLSCIGSPHSRARQLAALRKLDAHLLKDIGLTPEQVQRGLPRRAAPAQDAPRQAPIAEMRRPYLNR
jgi:uncharacterized protein YjiS (DUF1127 family)